MADTMNTYTISKDVYSLLRRMLIDFSLLQHLYIVKIEYFSERLSHIKKRKLL